MSFNGYCEIRYCNCSHFLLPLLCKSALPFTSIRSFALSSTLIEHTCHQMKNYSFCIQVFESDHRSAHTSDLAALTEIALHVALTNTTKSRAYLGDMLKRNETKPALKAVIETCIENYASNVSSFNSAYLKVKQDREYMTANYDCMLLMDFIGYCEKGLASSGVEDLSISSRNRVAIEFSLLGAALIDFLDTGSPS